MNKNIVLLIMATVFLFAGCKKDKTNTITESAVSLRAYPMEPISKDSNGTIIYQLRGSIIAPATFPIIDHGFLIRSSFGFIPVPLGVCKSIGSIETTFSIPGTITIYNDSLIFYIVLPNGDSIRSDKGLIQSTPTLPVANLNFTGFTATSSGINDMEVNLNINYNPASSYYLYSETLSYRLKGDTLWIPVNLKIGSPFQILNYQLIGNGISSLSSGLTYEFQIKVVLQSTLGLTPITLTTNPSVIAPYAP